MAGATSSGGSQPPRNPHLSLSLFFFVPQTHNNGYGECSKHCFPFQAFDARILGLTLKGNGRALTLLSMVAMTLLELWAFSPYCEPFFLLASQNHLCIHCFLVLCCSWISYVCPDENIPELRGTGG